MANAPIHAHRGDVVETFMQVCRRHASARDVDSVPSELLDIIAAQRRLENRAEVLARAYYAFALMVGLLLWAITGVTVAGTVGFILLASLQLWGVLPMERWASRLPDDLFGLA